jgi:DNA-binding GntR family transcriptional regulator
VLKTIASQYFVSNCLNGYLWQHTLGDLVYLYRQHREMLRALRHKNVVAARRMILEHAERGQRHAIELLERQEDRRELQGNEGEGDWLTALHGVVEGIVEDGLPQ